MTGSDTEIEFNLDFEPDPIDVVATMICGFPAIRRRLNEEQTCELHGYIQTTLATLMPLLSTRGQGEAQHD